MVLLSGCGGAVYTYEHISADGSSCKASIASLRKFQGAGLSIDKDCTLNGGANSMKGGYGFIKSLIKLAGAIK